MGVIAEKRIRCGCGTVLDKILVTVTWQGPNGMNYSIRGVPSLQCSHVGCEEVYYSGKVEFNLSLLAEEMEQGKLPTSVDYHEKF
jgi:hypothetical protein